MAVLAILVGTALLRLEDSPVPSEWNIFTPLAVSDPVSPLTPWKLDWATQDRALCLDVLSGASAFTQMDDLVEGEQCGIAPRVALTRVGNSAIREVETACATALRMTMWERHGLQPAAREILGADVARIREIGSYNCRMIRGSQSRWSTHATAQAIDITGFVLADGREIKLIDDWNGPAPFAEFLRRARDSACDWFGTTLGPDFNALHADHFHLQSRGWGTCR